jgi:hypothetical protein
VDEFGGRREQQTVVVEDRRVARDIKKEEVVKRFRSIRVVGRNKVTRCRLKD